MASTSKTDTSGFADVEDDFTDVETETQIVFDTVGDEFIGTFVGWSETPGGIPQAHFRNQDGTFFTNCGWDLKNKLSKCKTGRLTRIRLVDRMPIKDRETPMNVFQVGQKSS